MRPIPPAGWLIGVLVTPEDEPDPVRFHFAVGKPDQQRAEWAAVDAALGQGVVATSPVKGEEPVLAVSPIQPGLAKNMGLASGEVRPLGRRLPRRWLP